MSLEIRRRRRFITITAIAANVPSENSSQDYIQDGRVDTDNGLQYASSVKTISTLYYSLGIPSRSYHEAERRRSTSVIV